MINYDILSSLDIILFKWDNISTVSPGDCRPFYGWFSTPASSQDDSPLSEYIAGNVCHQDRSPINNGLLLEVK